MAGMPDHSIDLEKVVAVLAEATGPTGKYTQRGLSKAAYLQRDAVGDIVRGRNKNPTIKTLRSLAEAMETDLSVFGIVLRSEVPTEGELEVALLDALKDLPPGGPLERRARYLAQAVAQWLQLPPDPKPVTGSRSGQAPDADGPLPPTTN